MGSETAAGASKFEESNGKVAKVQAVKGTEQQSCSVDSFATASKTSSHPANSQVSCFANSCFRSWSKQSGALCHFILISLVSVEAFIARDAGSRKCMVKSRFGCCGAAARE